MVDQIKSSNLLWTPMEVSENPFANYTYEQIKSLVRPFKGNQEENFLTIQEEQIAIPESFDSRKEWPDCVHEIREYGNCDAAWAFAVADTFSDRVCIASGGKIKSAFSSQHFLSCGSLIEHAGCDGGYNTEAWTQLEQYGITTEECLPYTSSSGKVDNCPDTCVDGTAIKNYKCKEFSSRRTKGPEATKQLILNSGPVQSEFTVYEDFLNYKSGIYRHGLAVLLGFTDVKIVGWGIEGSIKYWICANYWGSNWGENGYFRIKEGEVGIDQGTYGCTPDLTSIQYSFLQ